MDTAIGQLPRFRRYGNDGNRTGIESYALLARGIALRFADGSVLLYDRDCPGGQHVDRMKELARAGSGLGTYISRHVGRRYGNHGNRAGIEAFALLARGIAIRFGDGSVLLYDRDCPGQQHVEKMKELARAGGGLPSDASRRLA